MSVAVENGHYNHQNPADFFVIVWDRGRPTSQWPCTSLITVILRESCQGVGDATRVADFGICRPIAPGQMSRARVGLVYTPLAVETYGIWAEVAQGAFSRLAAHAS